jgi:DNA-directed RNA polymerase subunit RPC12/RpoP
VSEVLRFRCPGCGSELETPEGTISNRCHYCGLVWILGRPGRIVKRYYVPRVDLYEARFVADHQVHAERRRPFGEVHLARLYYVPFYRFRGLSLSCLCKVKSEAVLSEVNLEVRVPTFELRARNLDLTVPGASKDAFGLGSLGIRPQALPTYAYRDREIPADAEVMPADVGPGDSEAAALQRNHANLVGTYPGVECPFSEMVGEGQALIYFPIYVISGTVGQRPLTVFVDGLSRRVYRQLEETWASPAHGAPAVGISDLQPEPHHGPHCGSDFEPSQRSLFYSCANCGRHYLLGAEGHQLYESLQIGAGPGRLYPFWRFAIGFEEPRSFRTVGEFARLLTADIPLLARDKADSPFYVYVPAFAGADAEWQVQTAVRTTRVQPQIVPGDEGLEGTPAVSLPPGEAAQFAAFAWNWLRMSYVNLRHDRFDFRKARCAAAELLWLPLVDERLERSVRRAGEQELAAGEASLPHQRAT